MLAEQQARRGWRAAIDALVVTALAIAACSSGGPHCETRKKQSRLNDLQQTAVEWTIEVCADLSGEVPSVTVTVTGKTIPGGDPVTPGNLVVGELDANNQRVDAHSATNSTTVQFDAEPNTEKVKVVVGRNVGMTVTEKFELSELE
jgi:hypothetical protein